MFYAMMLEPRHRTTLLQIAREVIAAELDRRSPVLPAIEPVLQRPSGAFVTLHTHDRMLRGCIGSIEAVAPLHEAVAQNAIHAAFRDPRFNPLGPAELPHVAIEISVMSPLEAIASVDDIVVGTHGLIVRSGFRAGLLLPQVASERGWDRETFLSQTCAKAGLPADSWRRKEVEIQRFSAEVFGELND